MITIIVPVVTSKTSDANAKASMPAGNAGSLAPKRVLSDTLLGPGGELVIVHGNREYRLRITQNGKLILTA